MTEVVHLVMLPWSAFGHMIPFFQLSLALAESGVRVTYVSTTRNIQRLPKVPQHLRKMINLVGLAMPTLQDGQLPAGAEATLDVPEEKIEHLKAAYDLLRQPFKELVVELSPDYMIIDMAPYWAVDIAREKQVSLIYYVVLSACSTVFFGIPEIRVGEGEKKGRTSVEDWSRPPEWVDFPSTVAYRKYEATWLVRDATTKNPSGVTTAERVFNIITSCQAVAVRTCPEFDGEYLKLLGKMLGKPVLPVGLLIPDKGISRDVAAGGSWEGIFKWLGGQEPKSVVYVGFGTEFKLSKEQVYEIAHGLELSGLPFLWALRRPQWASNDLEALPPGFRERTRGIGHVCFGWAPQLEILSHPSIGGTMFHSGWGSIIESLQYGHTLVLLPFIIDQPLNARLLVEKGLGVEVERREDGSFRRDDIARALKLAMVSEQGRGVRERAREAAYELFGNRNLQEEHLHKFVEFLKTK